MTTYFQPIFSARQKAVVGRRSARARRDVGGDLIAPYDLFRMAAEERLAMAVENLCRESAVRAFTRLDARPDELLLFLNLDLVDQPNPEAVPAELERLLSAAGVATSNVAVEFLEARLDDAARFAALATGLRERGSSSCSMTLARTLEPRSHPPAPPRRHQGRSQPHHGRRRRLLQARDAQEPRGPVAPHRRARRRRGHRDRGRGHRGARARRRPLAGLFPDAAAAGVDV